MKLYGWKAPNGIDSDKRADIKKALEEDSSFTFDLGKDPYWFGLDLGKAARLALIADELLEH